MFLKVTCEPPYSKAKKKKKMIYINLGRIQKEGREKFNSAHLRLKLRLLVKFTIILIDWGERNVLK